jgi:PQQ-dependent catabolism-associated beta-propeller protein
MKQTLLTKTIFTTILCTAVMQFVYASPTGRIFITNEKSNTVSVINGETLEVEKEIDIGDRPRGIGISPDGTEVYVAVSEENSIAVFDPKTLEVLRKFESGSDPETFAVHPNGNIYISNEDDAKASVYNPKTGELVAEIQVGLEPEGVAISPDGSKVIVTSESTNMLHVIAVPGHTITDNILVGHRPRAAVFTKDNKTAYATAEITGEIVKVDMENTKILKRAQLEDPKSKPKDVILSKDEKHIYVAGGRSNSVWLMDADTLEVIKGIPVGKRVWGLAITKDGSRVFTTDGVSGTVTVIDTSSNEAIKSITVGKFPWGVAIDD